MKILVTGGAGFLGTYLCLELEGRGHTVLCTDQYHGRNIRRVDIRCFRQLQSAINEFDPDIVYHLAAEFGRLNGEEFYEQTITTNILGTKNVLAMQYGGRFRLVMFSSSEVYGELAGDTLVESMDQQPLRPNNEYALTKWFNEMQCMNATDQHDSEIVRVRLFNAYGPGEFYHQYRSVICLFCYMAVTGQPYTVFEGYRRTFMSVRDLIPTLANIADNFMPGMVYNVGGNDNREVMEVHKLLAELMGREPEHRLLTIDKHNRTNKIPDISLARRDLGHDPKDKLEDFLPRTLEWFRNKYGETT